MNSVSISGRITKDAELKSTQSGISVCSFTVAVDRPTVKDKADFIDCVAWRHTAEFVSKYFRKGDPIELVGVITTRNYEDKNGNKRKAVEVVCEHVNFPKQKKRDGDEGCNSYQGTQEDATYGSTTQEGFEEVDYSDEDPPF